MTEHKKLITFINKFKVAEKPFTHLSSKSPAVALRIPSEHIDDFYKLYNNTINKPKYQLLYISECNLSDFAPLKVDIDIKANIADKRLYTNDELMKFIGKYVKMTLSIVDVKDEFNVVITEKLNSTEQNSGCHKDGFHLLFPELVVNHNTALFIREQVLKQGIIKKVFKTIVPINSEDDILDKCVIKQVNWPMIGSIGKPNSTTVYTISSILHFNTKGKVVNIIEHTTIPNISKYLSIRNKEENAFINNQFKQILNPLVKVKLPQGPIGPQGPAGPNNTDLSKVRFLLSILSDVRTTDYSCWLQVGWCLYLILLNYMMISYSFLKDVQRNILKKNVIKSGVKQKDRV